MKKQMLNERHREELLAKLKNRFEKNMHRHKSVAWKDVLARLVKHPEKFWSLHEMERTGGEPDVNAYDKQTGEITFCDCSAESPAGRRSLCYDQPALESRKEHKPANSAMNLASVMGIELLDESGYRALQKLDTFDRKTSSWIKTPDDVRKLGGALFCDWRYGKVFTYHNGAESYYASRGFRGRLVV
jgi:hypothetical protein